MSPTGIKSMDREVNVAMEWIIDAENEFGWDDRQKTFQAVRSTLHALRDRLTLEEAADLGAQLPTFLRGVYFEGFQPQKLPVKDRDVEDFLGHIRQEFKQMPVVDAELIAKKVFKVLCDHVSKGEMEDVIGMLPHDFDYLWEEGQVKRPSST
ncbi:DUF2267 domain-containing protein [Persicimonas caeni]|uniref:DUF2267 domain-containing protein n=1 Tax=Persicimonas caeni TaxID=2292766 RepID=A0A4Y6PYM1_PERCE|nr:DUF2267 domain-containing protein [Persicimonas caeni]QDG53259.1 DUF2267 domain-containing protein [Persicimonas caeni]QED34481.1 DUF2267 domain-containing protein [Persicimonas caeni]